MKAQRFFKAALACCSSPFAAWRFPFCLLYTSTDTTISVPDEDHAFSRIYASFMYNGRYTVEYEYADGEEETKRILVSIDFENKERISIELPQQVLAGRIVSDGRRIFGSDKDYIYLLNEDEAGKRITRGLSLIHI